MFARFSSCSAEIGGIEGWRVYHYYEGVDGRAAIHWSCRQAFSIQNCMGANTLNNWVNHQAQVGVNFEVYSMLLFLQLCECVLLEMPPRF